MGIGADGFGFKLGNPYGPRKGWRKGFEAVQARNRELYKSQVVKNESENQTLLDESKIPSESKITLKSNRKEQGQ
jgi:hypothetical protein